MNSIVTDKYDFYVSTATIIVLSSLMVLDMYLYYNYGEQYTISAYLRRVFTRNSAVLFAVGFFAGGLFAHIFLVK